MAGKRGKKDGGDKSRGGTGDGNPPGSLDPSHQVTTEILQSKLNDISDKLGRATAKVATLTTENKNLVKSQEQVIADKHDIVDFLNLKVGENERQIQELQGKLTTAEEGSRSADIRIKEEVSRIEGQFKDELENLTGANAKLKTELADLVDFMRNKEEMEKEKENLLARLDQKESQYRDTIYKLERKMLQDKSKLKNELLNKVNEAVSSFRRVAEQQMSETTKRTIRENMAITTQLKKMSNKTVELINENRELIVKNTKLKGVLVQLREAEKALQIKNQTSQNVIKMLVGKIKESDKMLEMAFEQAENDEDKPTYSSVPQIPEELGVEEERETFIPSNMSTVGSLNRASVLDSQSVDITHESISEHNSNFVSKDFNPIENTQVAVDGHNDLNSQDYLAEIAHLSHDNTVLVGDFRAVMDVIKELQEYWDSVICNIPDDEITDTDHATALVVLRRSIEYFLNRLTGRDPTAELARRLPEAHIVEEPQLKQSNDERSSLSSSASRPLPVEPEFLSLPFIPRSRAASPSASASPRRMLDLRTSLRKVLKLIPSRSATNSTGSGSKEDGIDKYGESPDHVRWSSRRRAKLDAFSSSCQTDPLPFGKQINTSYLLGELRPWGSSARTVPLAGKAVHLPRRTRLPPNSHFPVLSSPSESQERGITTQAPVQASITGSPAAAITHTLE